MEDLSLNGARQRWRAVDRIAAFAGEECRCGIGQLECDLLLRETLQQAPNLHCGQVLGTTLSSPEATCFSFGRKKGWGSGAAAHGYPMRPLVTMERLWTFATTSYYNTAKPAIGILTIAQQLSVIFFAFSWSPERAAAWAAPANALKRFGAVRKFAADTAAATAELRRDFADLAVSPNNQR